MPYKPRIWQLYNVSNETRRKVRLYAAAHQLTLPAALEELVDYAYDEYLKREQANEQE